MRVVHLTTCVEEMDALVGDSEARLLAPHYLSLMELCSELVGPCLCIPLKLTLKVRWELSSPP